MRPVHLHVLAGSHELLMPAALFGEQVAGLLGDNVRIATAFWLSRRCGRFYHDFLLEAAADARVAVFARSLRENFGNRFEPLIVLPDLALETTASTPPEHGSRSTFDVLLEICRLRPAARLVLHALALPKAVDRDGSWAGPGELLAFQAHVRLDGVRAALAAAGMAPDTIETRIIEVTPERPEFESLLRNALSFQIARRLQRGFLGEGFEIDMPRLTAMIAQMLERWREMGILPAPALGAQELDSLSNRVSKALFANVPATANA